MANKDFLSKNQITEDILFNCLKQVSHYSNRIKKLYDEEPFFTWELLDEEVLNRVIWLYDSSKVNIKTGEILEINPELNTKIPQKVKRLDISLSHKEKISTHIDLRMYAFCLKDNEWYETIYNINRKSSGIFLQKDVFGFDNTISLDLDKVNSQITSILFCAYLDNYNWKGDNFLSVRFDINQIDNDSKEINQTIELSDKINNANGVIVFELIRTKDWWKIELVKEKTQMTADELSDTYGEYLPFR